MPGQSLPDPWRRLVPSHGTDGQGVVAGDPPALASDIGLGAAGLLVGESETLQELVQVQLAAVERGDIVMGREFLDGHLIRPRPRRFSQAALVPPAAV